MTRTVYAVIGYEAYYPQPDNTIAVFDDRGVAESVCDDLQESTGTPMHEAIWEDLRDKYDWLPKHGSDHFEVIELEVRRYP